MTSQATMAACVYLAKVNKSISQSITPNSLCNKRNQIMWKFYSCCIKI